jgi:hypothetical protein
LGERRVERIFCKMQIPRHPPTCLDTHPHGQKLGIRFFTHDVHMSLHTYTHVDCHVAELPSSSQTNEHLCCLTAAQRKVSWHDFPEEGVLSALIPPRTALLCSLCCPHASSAPLSTQSPCFLHLLTVLDGQI